MASVFRRIAAFHPLLTVSAATMMQTQTHSKCRNKAYVGETFKRSLVPDEKVSWQVAWPEYQPVNFTNSKVLSMPVWADVDLLDENCRKPNYPWNEIDEEAKVNRKSHSGSYEIVDGLPQNPVGRTGMKGRGLLGRWGPNHAADPVVTRWKRGKDGKPVISMVSGKPILQFVAIQRRDNGEWAIPGGMVDPGETVSLTLKREFGEEALNSLCLSSQDKLKLEENVGDVFNHGIEIYRGYVDDPRNTDNAWMETVCMNFHDEDGQGVGMMDLNAGDDAAKVRWADISSAIKLYASHADFIQRVANLHDAHW